MAVATFLLALIILGFLVFLVARVLADTQQAAEDGEPEVHPLSPGDVDPGYITFTLFSMLMAIVSISLAGIAMLYHVVRGF